MIKALSTISVFLVLLISACSNQSILSPEEQIEKVLANIEENVEARSISGVLEHVSETYKDHRGQSKKDIAKVLQLHFIRNQQINIFTLIRSIEVENDLASVELSAAMASQGIDLNVEANRLRADTHRFSMVLSNTGQVWRLESVSWQRGW